MPQRNEAEEDENLDSEQDRIDSFNEKISESYTPEKKGEEDKP